MDFLPSFDIYPYVLLQDFLRYFIAASSAYVLFWMLFKQRWQHRMVQQKWPKWERKWYEFRYSMSTVVIFSLVGFSIVQLKMAGYTQLYDDISEQGWAWFVASTAIMFVVHDAYYYWVHRWMHHPKVFRYVHLVHHRSTNPSPWAAYSFHPVEAILEAAIYVFFIFVMPVHGLALMFFLVSMIIRNVVSHLGMEILPAWFIRSPWLNWMTTTTHHDLHHKNFNSNYGIYFTWWDRWFGTEDQKYIETFDEVTARPRENGATIRQLSKHSPLILLLGLGMPAMGQSPVGDWLTFDEKTGDSLAIIHIEEVAGRLEGQIAQLFLKPWEGTDPICTNCEGNRKDQSIIGMQFIWGFTMKGKKGQILDPASGEIYTSKMWLENDDCLKVRGYAGPFNLFYRTQNWKRKSPKQADNELVGTWETIDDQSGLPTALVEIKSDGKELYGLIKALYPGSWTGDDPICMKCPGEKKGKRIVGMNMLWNFEKDGLKWADGKILDPGNGRIYKGAIWMESASTLKIRGYWGPFYRTQTWSRLGTPLHSSAPTKLKM